MAEQLLLCLQSQAIYKTWLGSKVDHDMTGVKGESWHHRWIMAS